MFTIHVVLTSNASTIWSFLLYNCVTEMKISVFKKCDGPALYNYAVNDTVERFHLLIYLVNVLWTTNQDFEKMIYFAICFFVAEILTDHVKHFFIRMLNGLDADAYRTFEK